jgi:uncharacterized protein
MRALPVVILAFTVAVPSVHAQTVTPPAPVPDDSMRVLIDKARNGDPEAQYDLGLAYESGSGVPKDYAKALDWYRRAADQGSRSGLRAVALMHDMGLGVKQDYGTAVQGYIQAAEMGDVTAENNLRVMYERGDGIGGDYAEAAKWYQRASDHGNLRARGNLGALYVKGLGVEKDPKKD